MKSLPLYLVVSIAVGGCAHKRPEPLPVPPFPTEEYAALAKSGSSIIKGQIFLRTKGGEVRKGAGSTITLRPNTAYAQYFEYAPKQNKYRYDGRLPTYDRTVIADGDGRFEFAEVPAGSYLVSGTLTWSVFTPGAFGVPINNVQGGLLRKTVNVGENSKADVMLTQ